jgi:uncharacterized protein
MLRRSVVLGAAASAVVALDAPAWATTARRVRLLAAWDEPGAPEPHRMGIVEADVRGRTVVHASMGLPTRAHGLVWEADRGTALAVARRPGDWLVRWRPAAAPTTALWQWSPPHRRFNGHALRIGERVLTSETDFDADGRGVVVVRDAATLRELGVWDSHGRDPHALLWDATNERLWVANGGIGSDLATGRHKDLYTMDSSLVLLDAASDGRLRGQWRLDDARLSLRHLAQAADGSVGVALQAEHEDAAARETAPLLAVWHQERLRVVPHSGVTGGYGGDIEAVGQDFYVSATRSNQVLAWSARAGSRSWRHLKTAGAMTHLAGNLWCGGANGWTALMNPPVAKHLHTYSPYLRPDNHALALG